MATGSAIRADDGSGKDIATRTASEDAVTKHWQRFHLSDPTTPTQEVAVDASGNLAAILAANSGIDIGDVTVNNAVGAPVEVQIGDGTDTALVSAAGALSAEVVSSVSVEDSNNSTTTPLGISATFTGTSTDILNYSAVTVHVFADENGATDGMTFEFSVDGTNWDIMHTHTYTANEGRVFQFAAHSQFFRFVFINGGTAQTAFRVQTLLHPNTKLTTIHRLVDSTSPDRSANLVKSAIIAQAAGSGDFVPVQATATGNLKNSIEEIDGALTGAGAIDGSTQRVTVATDDPVSSTLAVVGGGTEAASQRVTIANDSTGLLPISASSLPLPTGAATSAAQLPDGHNVTVDNASLATTNTIVDGWDNAASDGASVSGDVAHSTTDAGEPVKVGHKAISTGADPTEVAADERSDWYTTRAGIPFTIGGHPNILTKHLNITDADGAQTDTNLLAGATGATDVVVVTALQVTADNANTGDVSYRCGFGAAATPALDAAKMLSAHPGVASGSGLVIGNGAGILGIGASGEDLFMDCEDPAGGSIDFIVHYFIMDNS